ncbi:MAG: zinc ABC transporter substrate-binding protein [Magnetococcales bacterium]|nr:zinc ABC transporter substrate-binding protein [Magnetococcales bacterium]
MIVQSLVRFSLLSFLAFFILMGLLTSALSARSLKVVASIAPIHSLVAGLMVEGSAAPHLLVRGGGSPHTTSLRPSDAQALQEADLVFWIGPGLEAFLVKPLSSGHLSARVVTLHTLPALNLLDNREAGEWSEAADESEEGGDHAAEHGHGEKDMHLWLDPHNAKVLVKGIAHALMEADPINRAGYQYRMESLLDRLERLDKQIAHRLQSVKGEPYIVFHDGFHYFDHRYQLSPLAAITPSPEHQPGARRMREVRTLVMSGAVRCLFQEPQFYARMVQSVIEGSSAKRGVIDPLGSAVEPGPDHYFKTMWALAVDLTNCLSPANP